MSTETFIAPELAQLAPLFPAYELEAFIAQGGMGAVYKARQRSLDRDVAIKILPREFGANPEFRESFETEAKAMAKLNHPNLIGVYDFGDVDGMPYIVMEFVNGKSLYRSAWNKIVEAPQAVAIVHGICRGIGHAHEHGIHHRDIKPANILLTPKVEPKIGDFGLAQLADSDGPSLLMGTPGYAAPELTQAPDSAAAGTDIFAIGVILNELLTGKGPDPEGNQPLQPCGDSRLDEIWKKATNPDIQKRYLTAEEMANDLAAWEHEFAPNAPRTTSRPKPSKSSPPGAAATTAEHAGTNWPLMRNLLIIAFLLGAIGVTYSTLKRAEANRKAAIEVQKQEQVERKEARKAELLASMATDKNSVKEAGSSAEPEAPANTGMIIAPEPEPIPETPAEALSRLKSRLAGGDRSEFPADTIQREDSHFLVINDPLPWHHAATFAEEHGGHLAVATSEEELDWLQNNISTKHEAAWIGAGRSGRDTWTFVDGSKWPAGREPKGVGSFAKITNEGSFRSAVAKERLPFVIQWHRDVTNPGTLVTQLRTTGESIESPSPVFPPGTTSMGDRHFVIIHKSVDLSEARALSELAGGNLATLATREEADLIGDYAKEFPLEAGAWLGGYKEGLVWKWDSGEEWNFAAWSEDPGDTPQGAALVQTSNGGWQRANSDALASGFVIEWSNDPENTEDNTTDPGETVEMGAGIADLTMKASELVGRAKADRATKLKTNLHKFEIAINRWLRGLTLSSSQKWTPHVDKLRGLIKESELPGPDAFNVESGISLSPEMAEACEYHYAKQKEINAIYTAKLTRLRDAYTTRIRESADEATEMGQTAVAQNLMELVEKASDVHAWADGLTEN